MVDSRVPTLLKLEAFRFKPMEQSAVRTTSVVLDAKPKLGSSTVPPRTNVPVPRPAQTTARSTPKVAARSSTAVPPGTNAPVPRAAPTPARSTPMVVTDTVEPHVPSHPSTTTEVGRAPSSLDRLMEARATVAHRTTASATAPTRATAPGTAPTRATSSATTASGTTASAAARVALPNDIFCRPWASQFPPLSAIVSMDDTSARRPSPAGSADFQYRIDPKECVFCQQRARDGLGPLSPPAETNYHVVVTLAPAVRVEHPCKQRELGQTPVSAVHAWVVSVDHPQGTFRSYVPGAGAGNGKAGTHASLAEFGHLMDHASAVFVYDDEYVYGMLRHTPYLVSELEDLCVPHDYNLPWPAQSDSMVPGPHRAWWDKWINPERAASVERDTGSASAAAPATATGQLATLDPEKEWPRMPPFDDKHPDWEGVTDAPVHLWDWTVSPSEIKLADDRAQQQGLGQPGLPEWRAALTTRAPPAHLVSSSAVQATPTHKAEWVTSEASVRRPVGGFRGGRAARGGAGGARPLVTAPVVEPRLAPAGLPLAKPSREYFSELRMRDWRAKTWSLCKAIKKLLHSSRHFSLAQLMQMNEAQPLMRSMQAHVARVWPFGDEAKNTSSPSDGSVAASEQLLHPLYRTTGQAAATSAATAPPRTPPPGRTPTQSDAAIGSVVVTARQYISWREQKAMDRVHAALRYELACTVDLSWCFWIRGMRLVIPDTYGHDKAAMANSQEPAAAMRRLGASVGPRSFLENVGPYRILASHPLGDRFPHALARHA